jgi:hypothetical protein
MEVFRFGYLPQANDTQQRSVLGIFNTDSGSLAQTPVSMEEP